MFHFVANLKPYTYRPGRGGRRFNSYLLSIDYYREFKELARTVRREGRFLVADNGNVSRIRRLIAQFEVEAAVLGLARKVEDQALGHYARPGELSAPLTQRFQELAQRIFTAGKDALDAPSVSASIKAQIAMQPTYLVGMEDLAMPVLTSLSLEPEYVGLPASWYRTMSDRAVDYALRTRDGEFGASDALVFAGLHAMDYDTARQAGTAAGEAGVDGIASGLVGTMKDVNAVDYRIEEGRVVPLGRPAARAYLRVVETIAGVHRGFVDATGRRPRFHALGAGSPILIPLLALLGDADSYTSTDSTAPIVDGWSSKTISLYVHTPAFVKLKAHRIAEFWLKGNRPWECRCPFCRQFNARHPPDITSARAWWIAQGSPRLEATHMLQPSPLAEWMPLLSCPVNADLRREGGLARVGHNHWILQKIERQARAAAKESSRLRDWAAKALENYGKFENGSPTWQASARAAWELADSTAARLAGAAPSGTLPGPHP